MVRYPLLIGVLLPLLWTDGSAYSRVAANPPDPMREHVVQAMPVSRDLRSLNEITIPSTHNSYNYGPKFQLPNVNEPVATQLRQGIRAFELDIDRLNGELQLFHKAGGLLGAQPAADVLTDIRDFIQAHPQAIVAIKLQTPVPAAELQELVQQVGLLPYLYVHAGGSPPSPQALIEANQRVLMLNALAQHSAQLPLCYTRWDRQSPADLWPPREHASPCRGDYLSLIAYAVDVLGTGSPDYATEINDYDYLLKLAETAWKLNGKKIWQVIVDFPDLGDVYRVTRTLNQWTILKGEVHVDGKVLPQVSWQNTYSRGTASGSTTTYGRFSFPVQPGETVTVTPSHPDYTFVPATVTVEADNAQDDIVQNFQAMPRSRP